MRRFVLPGGIAAAVIAFLIVLVIGMSESNNGLANSVRAGHTPKAPDAHLREQELSGDPSTDLAAYRGHYVMVEFFAGWCDACQADAGLVHKAQNILAAHGGKVLGVSFQDSTNDALSYMNRYHLSFPVMHDGSGDLAKAYGVNGVPETFIVNPRGKVVAGWQCEMTKYWLTTTLNRVLGDHMSTKGLQDPGCAVQASSS